MNLHLLKRQPSTSINENMKQRSDNTLRLIATNRDRECYWVEGTGIYIDYIAGTGWISTPCFQLLGSTNLQARILAFQADARKWSSWINRHGISTEAFGSKEELLVRIETTLQDHPL